MLMRLPFGICGAKVLLFGYTKALQAHLFTLNK